MRRVVITGMGVVSPIGNTIDVFTESLRQGKHGIGPITRYDASADKVTLAAEVKDLVPEEVLSKQELRRMDLFSVYGLIAADQAVRDAKLDTMDDKSDVGVYVGSGIGGMDVFMKNDATYLEKGPGRVSPFFIPSMIANMATGLIAIEHGFQGATLPVVTACATSTNTIGEAYRNIKDGYSNVIVAGGTEASINRLAIAGFTVLTALSTSKDPDRASIPFDDDRDGFVMGEGAAVLVLEELSHAQARGATIYAEVTGYGNTCDAHHMTAPDPDAKGAVKAIQQAMGDANMPVVALYYNAHGTSTPLNDAAETQALKTVFGEDAKRLSISSTKSMTGHMLGAAGAIEVLACVQALRHGFVPPTVGTEHTSAPCDLNYTTGQAVEKPITHALSTSLGFGGHNACVALKRWQDE